MVLWVEYIFDSDVSILEIEVSIKNQTKAIQLFCLIYFSQY